jgi:hypothetical protein
MSTYSPSYLHKNRYGIFHFRCRIPSSIREKYNLKKVEVRKSLRTAKWCACGFSTGNSRAWGWRYLLGWICDVLDLPSRKKVINKIKYPSIDWGLVKERWWRQTPFTDNSPTPNRQTALISWNCQHRLGNGSWSPNTRYWSPATTDRQRRSSTIWWTV